MRAFILPGARQVIGGEDRQHEPSEHQHFEYARHATCHKIKRERRERDNATDKPRPNESTVTRGSQRVVVCRRVHQGVDIVANRLKEAHVFQCTPERLRTRSPCLFRSCQRPLKRVLRRNSSKDRPRSIMVNAKLQCVALPPVKALLLRFTPENPAVPASMDS
jgi:hypothetical protein